MILGEVLSQRGVSQLRTAETEKYAHVTYFFNGGVEQAFPGEERRLVPSNRDVATYDLAPEMSAAPVTDGVVEALKPGGPGFILVNYANPDMVGHTGMLKPAVSALETIDACVGRVVTAAAAVKATVFITADHGNCETMIDPQTGQPHTAHTTNPIPFIAIADDLIGQKLRAGGRLADVAPTVLDRMGIAQPPDMDGRSLFS
jgi:2,3-bisphosphoglycerate-independent phosphoglycerate mutase